MPQRESPIEHSWPQKPPKYWSISGARPGRPSSTEARGVKVSVKHEQWSIGQGLVGGLRRRLVSVSILVSSSNANRESAMHHRFAAGRTPSCLTGDVNLSHNCSFYLQSLESLRIWPHLHIAQRLASRHLSFVASCPLVLCLICLMESLPPTFPVVAGHSSKAPPSPNSTLPTLQTSFSSSCSSLLKPKPPAPPSASLLSRACPPNLNATRLK
jgi:hypothetical protein